MDLYHALNRGVDKRALFIEEGDYVRFVHDMYEFNDERPANNIAYLLTNNDLRSRYYSEREKLVEIHGWCLMKNHYHLLLSENTPGGITKFLRKLNIGYAKYFNEKYKRDGTLFQGRTKKIVIASDAHFLHILHYIHLNPLDYGSKTERWRERAIADAQAAIESLGKYRWSSYLDYCGKENFPSILTKELFKDVFGNYSATITAYIADIEIEKLRPLVLE